MRYEPESWKAALGIRRACWVGAADGDGVARGWSGAVETWSPRSRRIAGAARRRLLTAAGLLLLAYAGVHSAVDRQRALGARRFRYFPRLVEVHQNITHGVLLPRWAPDLGRGAGQPLFLVHPPMFYYLGESWPPGGIRFRDRE